MGSMLIGLVLVFGGLLIALSGFVPSLSPDWALAIMTSMRDFLHVGVGTARLIQLGLGLVIFLVGCYTYSAED